MKKGLGKILIAVSIITFIAAWYVEKGYARVTRPFSIYDLLNASWNGYKDIYINEDGRVIDHSLAITTSEGQSYALLRALYLDDKKTFDKVFEWTENNLKRKEDSLYSWKWGENDDGSYGVVGEDGYNSASDADVDIALALILANKRWNQYEYLERAKELISDIWSIEVAEVAEKNYLVAGNWANRSDNIVINPSYFAPYAWRLFAEIDTQNDWMSLVNPSYEVLHESTFALFGYDKEGLLPPDWIQISKRDGAIEETNIEGLATNYSFDAIRVPLRIYIDYVWFEEPQAKKYLSEVIFLTETYRNEGKLHGSYSHIGDIVYSDESPAMYSTALFFLEIQDKKLAQKMYEDKIINLYTNDENSFDNTLGYYEQNLLWFAIALYEGRMPLL